MTNVYIEKEGAPELPMSLVFWPNYRFEISPKRLFLRDIMAQYKTPFFEVVADPTEADFFAVPYEYFDVADRYPAYLLRVYEKARMAGKKVLLFDYTDYVDRIPEFPAHAVLFRVSVYRHHKQPNELLMPYFVEDLGTRYAIGPKEWKGEPSIGYCGQSDFGTSWRHIRARVKWGLSFLLLLLRFDAKPLVHQRGIFWRKRALAIIKRSELKSDITVRRFYALHQKSGSFNAEEVRATYVENLRANDFSLCVRGDANASQRFYETLSASRIPLFVDTDCVLPLEEIIDYDKVMLRVSWRDLVVFPQKVREFVTKASASDARRIEQDARAVYDEYLRLDRFFSLVFDRNSSPYRDILYTTLPARL